MRMPSLNFQTLSRCAVSIFLANFLLLNLHTAESKPADAPDKLPPPSSHGSSQPVFTRRSQGAAGQSSGRKVLTSLREDGTWQASARLPTTSQSGGNDHSRYKIRRDGSLSLSLQSPKSHHNHHLTSTGRNSGNLGESLVIGRSNSRQFSPSELRSFSVVISDVDVTGNYNKNIHGISEGSAGEDAYSKAGVSSYHLKSNSIHRMNASWKLKAGHLTPSSDDLLEFLSYFANSDGRATRSEVEEQKSRPPFRRKILGQREDVNDQHNFHEEKVNNQPFLTWSESSRNIPLSSSTELIETVRSSGMNETLSGDAMAKESPSLPSPFTSSNSNSNASTTTSSSSSSTVSKEAKVLHDLLSTLEELNESADSLAKTQVSSDGIEIHARNNTHDDKGASSSQLQSQQTELDQAHNNSAEKQVHLVDEEMTESLQKKGEKEGELFVENDEAKIFDSNGNRSDSNTTHNSGLASSRTSSSLPSSSSSSLQDAQNERKKKKRNAKSAFFETPTKSANRDDHEDDENEEYDNSHNNSSFNTSARSTSATSLLLGMGANNSTKRMKLADPQQTASDLKKLMSLILKSDGNRNGIAGLQLANTGSLMGEEERKSGAQVVNIVITPNQETFLTPSPHLQISHSPQVKLNGPQKILFLKTPQVKQMLDIAISDPAVSSAAQKIAAALESNPFPSQIPANNADHAYGPMPGYVGDEEAVGPTAPNGFPISGAGFLNMNHPNLQFHQALHHMIVNGTTPTTINATTKTNVINIFVINFKENNNLHGGTGTSAEDTGVLQHQVAANQSPFRIKIRPSHRPKLPLPVSVKPLLIESVSATPTPDLSALFFHNKMGLAAEGEDDEAEAIIDPNKNFDMAHQHHTSSTSDKINIFDLLPGDIGAVTAIQYAPGVETDSQNETIIPDNNKPSPLTMPYSDYFADFLPDRSREPPGNENPSQAHNEHDIFSILTAHRPKRPVNPESAFSPMDHDALPPALAHLKWIFKNQPPPKPHVSNQDLFLKRKGQSDTDKSDDGLGNASSDSMMEPEETTHSPMKYTGSSTQELVDFLMRLQNVTRPLSSFDLNELAAAENNSSKSANPSTSKNGNIANLLSHHQHNHHHHQHYNSSDSSTSLANDTTTTATVVHYTTKRPAFWKFGNKLPVGNFNSNSNNDEALNNRLRKLLTAFGYSAIPTIAAGAAATWPFWVPLMATGKRRKRSSPFSNNTTTTVATLNNGRENGENSPPIPEIIERRGQSFITNAMIKSNNSNYTSLNEKKNATQQAPSNRQLLSKSTKNSRREGNSNLGGEKKWIKVDVITASTPFSSSSSSPTLHELGEENDNHSHDGKNGHSHTNGPTNTKNNQESVNRNGEKQGDDSPTNANQNLSPQQKHRHDEKQQLDLPLIKDFLKNVLYSEFNMPTKAPSPLTTKPPRNNEYKLKRPHVQPSTTATPTTPSPYPIFGFTNSNNNFNKLITKNGQYGFTKHSTPNRGGGNQNPPFSRPSSTPSSSLLFHSSEQMMSGGDKIGTLIPQLTTPSPASVYIHNRGDGTTSALTTSAPAHFSTAASLVHQWLNEKHKNKNNPWGSSFGNDADKIGTSITDAFANTAAALNGHNNGNYNGPSKNTDYLANQFYEQTNRVVQKRKVADSIRAAERSYASAALFPLWFPILFSNHGQVSAKLKEAMNIGKYA